MERNAFFSSCWFSGVLASPHPDEWLKNACLGSLPRLQNGSSWLLLHQWHCSIIRQAGLKPMFNWNNWIKARCVCLLLDVLPSFTQPPSSSSISLSFSLSHSQYLLLALLPPSLSLLWFFFKAVVLFSNRFILFAALLSCTVLKNCPPFGTHHRNLVVLRFCLSQKVVIIYKTQFLFCSFIFCCILYFTSLFLFFQIFIYQQFVFKLYSFNVFFPHS